MSTSSKKGGKNFPRKSRPAPPVQNRQVQISKKSTKQRQSRNKAALRTAFAIASHIPGPIGGFAKGLKTISGFGDYTVNSNTVSTIGDSADSIPAFIRETSNSVRIRHREFLGDVTATGSVVFNANTYSVNPGNRATFPWLYSIARKYQQYRMHGAVFVFKTMSTDYAAASALGSLVMASNYDTRDKVFTSKLDMENTEYCVSTKPSRNVSHPIECDPRQTGNNLYYIQPDDTIPIEPLLYNLCNTTIATVGSSAPSGAVLGELWLTYDVELLKPVSGAATYEAVLSAGQQMRLSPTTDKNYPFGSTISQVAGVLTTMPLGLVTYNSVATPTDDITFYAASNQTVITFNRLGTYTLAITTAGTGFAATKVWPNTQAGLISVNSTALLTSTDNTQQTCWYYITVTGIGATMTLSASAATTVVNTVGVFTINA